MPSRTIPGPAVDYWKERNLDPVKMVEIRDRCQRDLFYLCQVLGYPDFQPGGDVDLDDPNSPQREMCRFMVQKNPDIPFREFCKQDTTSHERLIMVSRGGLKSTICTIVDSVQWIVCYPDITILFITGTQALGDELLSETKGHFERQETGEPKIINGVASIFQLAFPEFCTDGEESKSYFVTPARENRDFPREATLTYGMAESNLSGPHYDICKGDDCVTNENSHNSERIKGIKKQMSLHHKVRQPWGYFDNIGTWYDPSDNNGAMVAAEEKNKTLLWNNGMADSRDIGDRQLLTKIMVRPCMWRKDGAEPLIDGDLREDDWFLWWGKRLSWKYLMRERVNLETFATQYMQNPSLGKKVRFTRERIVAATKIFTQLPDIHSGGLVVQYWDTSYKDGSPWNNFSVGVTTLILGGKFHYVDIVRGQWNEHDLPRVMADFAFKWRPKRFAIEDANGVRWLVQHALYPALKSVGIQNIWVEYLATDNHKGSKETNVKPFAKALLEGRVIFSNAIPEMDYVITEFEQFPSGEHDDVVDACAAVVRMFGEVPEAIVRLTEDDVRRMRQTRQDRMMYNHIFGSGVLAPVQQNAPTQVEEIPSYVLYDPTREWGG